MKVLTVKTCFSLIFLEIIYFSYVVGECPTIKTRREWGGTHYNEVEYQIIPVKYVIVQHTAGERCSTFTSCSEQVRNIQDFHMNQLGWSDIGYNFLIGDDGFVYEGAGWHKVGAHTYGWNKKSIGIGFMGNFDKQLPSEQALNAAKNLLQCGVDKGELDKNFRLYAARQVQSTVSPGLKLYNEIQDWDNWSQHVS